MLKMPWKCVKEKRRKMLSKIVRIEKVTDYLLETEWVIRKSCRYKSHRINSKPVPWFLQAHNQNAIKNWQL